MQTEPCMRTQHQSRQRWAVSRKRTMKVLASYRLEALLNNNLKTCLLLRASLHAHSSRQQLRRFLLSLRPPPIHSWQIHKRNSSFPLSQTVGESSFELTSVPQRMRRPASWKKAGLYRFAGWRNSYLPHTTSATADRPLSPTVERAASCLEYSTPIAPITSVQAVPLCA